MSTDSDTHDHGPPNTTTSAQSLSASTLSTLYPKLAKRCAKLSDNTVNAISGGVSGVASGIVTCPLDVIKTKLQAQGSFTNSGVRYRGYYGLLGTARTIVQQDGVRGLYRGLSPMLLGYLPTWAVYMTIYESTKKHLLEERKWKENRRDTVLAQIYAALLGGSCSTIATNPIWVIKTRLMSQISRTATDGARTPWQYNNTIDAAKQMWKAEGVRVFYAGLAPAMLGLTHVCIQFPLYEFFKLQFTGTAMGESSKTASSEPGQQTVGILAATFLAKMCATTATYPHEVLRTRLQTQQQHARPETGSNGIATSHHSESVSMAKRVSNTDGRAYEPRYKGVVNTFRIILREEGWRAFYNGMGTNMIRAVPAAMTTMLTYEWVKTTIIQLREDGDELTKEPGRQKRMDV